MSYSCDNCHAEFKTPHRYDHKDFVEYWGSVSWEVTDVTYRCPGCGSEDYVELQPEEEDEE